VNRCGRLVRGVAALVLCPAAIAMAAPADFTGVWARFPDPYGNSPFPDDPPPPGGEPRLRAPYASAFKAYWKRKEMADKEGKPLIDASTQCLPEGMPTIMGAVYNIQLLQTPGEMVVLAEFLTQTRRIFLNEKMLPLGAITPSYNGYSVGHWEGDTLVVRTEGVREDARFFNMPHTRNMVITERLRLTAPDRLENQVKIEDPTILLAPYEFTYGYKKDPTYKIMEYICDDNHSVAGQDGSYGVKITPN
jgi:hypothetical protein